MKVPPALAGAVLESATGASCEIGTLWRQRPVVLVWLRHFG